MTAGPVGAAPPFRRPVLVGLLLFALTLRGPFVVISTVTGELHSELGMSATAIGVLTSLPVLCFGLAAPGASALISRLGVERSVLLSLIGTLVGVLIRSTGGIPGALFGTLVMGLAITVGNVVSPVLIGRDFRGRAATVTGGYTAALNVGSMITLSATGPLVTQFGWQLALAAWAVLPVIALARMGAPGAPAHGSADAHSEGAHAPCGTWSRAFFAACRRCRGAPAVGTTRHGAAPTDNLDADLCVRRSGVRLLRVDGVAADPAGRRAGHDA